MMEFSRNDLLEAIKKIDENPALRNKRSSSTYDLAFDEKTYPPILVLSVANQLKGGEELFLADFDDKVEIPFKILADHGFEITRKNHSYNHELIRFLQQAKTNDQKTSHYQKSILDLSVNVSFGKGAPAKIPWISFLRKEVTTSNGIYPVYLYFKKEGILILAYGISETNDSQFHWPIKQLQTIEEYFRQNNLGKPFRYGKSYIYKVYDTNNMPDQKTIDKELISLLEYYKSLQLSDTSFLELKVINFDLLSLDQNLINVNLKFAKTLTHRFVASLLTKPFVILTGLSGSGKTKIAQSFVQWICESKDQYKIVPVGADWTNREPLLGYPNGLESKEYITPDSGVIHLFLEALKEKNKDKPYFLILDEMNLSHVERYFADFLSIMESEDTIKLYTGIKRQSLDEEVIPKEIGWPTNLFIIGTVNIDETTYMFSPKVLDRANVIEFRVTADDIGTFLSNPTKPDLKLLEAKGAAMAADFLRLAGDKRSANTETATLDLLAFFNQLKKVGAEFGYRSASEIMILINQLKRLNPAISDYECLDIAIMQKLLPKLHGSRSKLAPVLKTLAALCVDVISTNEFEKTFDDLNKIDFADISVKYEISFEKIVRMYRNVLANGFTSYAEA